MKMLDSIYLELVYHRTRIDWFNSMKRQLNLKLPFERNRPMFRMFHDLNLKNWPAVKKESGRSKMFRNGTRRSGANWLIGNAFWPSVKFHFHFLRKIFSPFWPTEMSEKKRSRRPPDSTRSPEPNRLATVEWFRLELGAGLVLRPPQTPPVHQWTPLIRTLRPMDIQRRPSWKRGGSGAECGRWAGLAARI